MRKKEDPEVMKERIRKFRSKPGYSKIEITNIEPELKDKFLGVTGSSYREKLENLILLWEKNLIVTEPVRVPSEPERINERILKGFSDFQKELENKVHENKLDFDKDIKQKRTITALWREALENTKYNEILESLNKTIHPKFKSWLIKGYFNYFILPEHLKQLIKLESHERREVILLTTKLSFDRALLKIKPYT